MRISQGNLADALAAIGKNDKAAEHLLRALREIETEFDWTEFDVRENITGPFVDGMYSEDSEVEKELKDGLVFRANYTSKIIRDFLLTEDKPQYVWEPQTSHALLELSKGAKTVLIGGAYIGDHAVLIANQIGPDGKVHCFEPGTNSARLLRTNAKRNGIDNIVVREMGLWGAESQLKLDGDDSHAAPTLADEGDDSFSATTIDNYCASEGIGKIDLIQLDIEGGELEALKGAEKLLSDPERAPDAIVFEVHSLYTDWSNGLENVDIVQYLKGFGYTVYGVRDYNGNEPMEGRPIELVPAERSYIEGPPHGFNMLGIKDDSRAHAAPFKVVHDVSPKLLRHRDQSLYGPLS